MRLLQSGLRLARPVSLAAVVAVLLVTACRVAPAPTDPLAALVPDLSQPPLPPTHPLLFGYFYADGRYGDYAADVHDHTNVYVACPRCHDTAADWRRPLEQAVTTAARDGRSIVVIAGESEDWNPLLDVLAPVWPRVRFIEIAHEARIRRGPMEARIREWRARVTARRLAQKPVGAMEALCQTWNLWRCALWNGTTSPLLDYVGVEAYPPLPGVDPTPAALPFPGDMTAAHVAANLQTILTRAAARLAPHQRLYLATLAYDRNGAWTDRRLLPLLQRVVYDWARDRPAVEALLPFAYARPGGVRDDEALRRELAAIGRAVTGPR